MKIVILDGYALNPGDLSWDELRKVADVEVHDRTPEAEVVARAADAEMVMTNKTPLSAATLRQLPNLRYIGVLATGYNVIDTALRNSAGSSSRIYPRMARLRSRSSRSLFCWSYATTSDFMAKRSAMASGRKTPTGASGRLR